MYFISDLSCSNSSWFTAVHSVALSRASYNYVHAWAWLSRRRCDVSLPLGYVLLLIYGGLWSRKIVTSLSNRRQVIAIYCLVTRLTTFHGKLRQWRTLASLPNPTQSLLHRRLFLRSTVSVVLALPTSKVSACRCRILLLGALSVRRSVVTCLFLEQEQWSSVDGVSQWLLRSSGIHYRLTYDHHW